MSASAPPATAPKVASEDIISQKTDLCISNAIVKAGLGFGSGVLLSVILFRRRAFPVWLGTGFGLGSAWTDCERSFNPVAIPGVRILPSPHHSQAPSPGQPSVMERLGAKTADLVEKGKDVAQQAGEKTKSLAEEATEEAKAKAKELEQKAQPRRVTLFSTVEPTEQTKVPSNAPNEQTKVASVSVPTTTANRADIVAAKLDDCFGCKVIRWSVPPIIFGLCFYEAMKLHPHVVRAFRMRRAHRAAKATPKRPLNLATTIAPEPKPVSKDTIRKAKQQAKDDKTPLPDDLYLRYGTAVMMGGVAASAGIYSVVTG